MPALLRWLDWLDVPLNIHVAIMAPGLFHALLNNTAFAGFVTARLTVRVAHVLEQIQGGEIIRL